MCRRGAFTAVTNCHDVGTAWSPLFCAAICGYLYDVYSTRWLYAESLSLELSCTGQEIVIQIKESMSNALDRANKVGTD